MGDVIIFTHKECSYSQQLKNLLNELNVDYSEFSGSHFSLSSNKRTADEIGRWINRCSDISYGNSSYLNIETHAWRFNKNKKYEFPMSVIGQKNVIIGFDESKIRQLLGKSHSLEEEKLNEEVELENIVRYEALKYVDKPLNEIHNQKNSHDTPSLPKKSNQKTIKDKNPPIQENKEKNNGSTSINKFCYHCGNELNKNDIFCSKCGKKLATEANCGNCGAKIKENALFCSKCGEKI